MKLLVPLGTRPEFIKLAPVVAALEAGGHEVETVVTGQHFDRELADVFLDEFKLVPDHRWQLSGSEAERTGSLLSAALELLGETAVDAVMVLGDTNTVPLFAFAARRHRRPVIHLEAGLRSGNETSMEEVNRRIAAATSALHLAPTERASRNLLSEGIASERVRVVGNPVLDALRLTGIEAVPVDQRRGVTVTLHRATNVDDRGRLGSLLDLVAEAAGRFGEVTFPLHPRTRQRITDFGLEDRLVGPRITVCRPLPFSEMIRTIARSRAVLTDSGGLQEEAAWFGVPAVVLRPTTPRWEGVDAGIAAVTGADRGRALAALEMFCRPEHQERVSRTPCPYGDGQTATRVADLLADPATSELLTICEPDVAVEPPPL